MQDEQDIPLLKDVVDPEEIELIDNNQLADQETGSHQAVPETLRNQITRQINDDLQSVINSAIHTAVEQASGEIRQILLDELQGSLHNHIRQLIDEALQKQPGQ
ncbi:MAG: hypothetical protein QNJ78_01690 [Gammaproteobacteria bacterium]|nr:hypothetical protein [Gammaproteobacteria bacterium]